MRNISSRQNSMLATLLTEAIYKNLLLEASKITKEQFRHLQVGDRLVNVSTEGLDAAIVVTSKAGGVIKDGAGNSYTFEDLVENGYGVSNVDTQKKQSHIISAEFRNKVWAAHPKDLAELKDELVDIVQTSGISQKSKDDIYKDVARIKNISQFSSYVTNLSLKKHGLGVK